MPKHSVRNVRSAALSTDIEVARVSELAGAAQDGATHFVLRLFVAGSGERSMRAVERIARLCERYLPGRYELTVIDIYQEPAMVETAQVVAAPTLVKRLPEPLRRVVGDMADEGRILVALNIQGVA